LPEDKIKIEGIKSKKEENSLNRRENV